MDRAAFENVYLNANCIAEIGLVRAMLALAGAPPTSQAAAAVPAAPIVEDESALDGVLGIGELTPEQLAQQVARVEAMMRRETGAPGDAPFTPFIANYYRTDPISRASPTMAECTALFAAPRLAAE